MVRRKFIVRPIDRAEARRLCLDHGHNKTLPNSSRYYLRLDIDGKPAGLAAWGWGVNPKKTAKHLFSSGVGVKDYLELCRFFVYDWVPKNTPSRFLSVTHRMIKKYLPRVKFLYTYAAGFQGLVGHIYKGAGYDYLGKQPFSACFMVPNVGLVHWLSFWHRYHIPIGSGAPSQKVWDALEGIWPGVKQWHGYNFRYLYWLCDRGEKKELMQHARFTVQPYPTIDDVQVWTLDSQGNREDVDVEIAKSASIIKLKTKRQPSRGPLHTSNDRQCEADPAAPTLAGART